MGMTREQMMKHVIDLFGEDSEKTKSFEKLCADCYGSEMWPLVEVDYGVLIEN